MKLSALPENVRTKTIIRQESDYEAAGIDGCRTVPLPWDESCYNLDRLTELGFHIPGVIRQHNQNLVENIGNSYGASVRKAVEDKVELPGEEEFNALVERYDYSGSRAPSEAGMPLEERTLRTMLKQQLRALIREGVFSANGQGLAIQTTKEAERKELPDGKMLLDDFNAIVESAIEAEVIEYDGLSFDFSGEPQFDENGDFLNFAAVLAFAQDLADQEMAIKAKATSRTIRASIPQE